MISMMERQAVDVGQQRGHAIVTHTGFPGVVKPLCRFQGAGDTPPQVERGEGDSSRIPQLKERLQKTSPIGEWSSWRRRPQTWKRHRGFTRPGSRCG